MGMEQVIRWEGSICISDHLGVVGGGKLEFYITNFIEILIFDLRFLLATAPRLFIQPIIFFFTWRSSFSCPQTPKPYCAARGLNPSPSMLPLYVAR